MAKDSSFGPFFVTEDGEPVQSSTPVFQGTSPFLAEDGYSDPNIGTSHVTPTFPDYGGYMQVIDCFPDLAASGGTPATAAYCVVKAMTVSKYTVRDANSPTKISGICPRGFVPVYSVATEKSAAINDSFACPAKRLGSTTLTPGRPVYDNSNNVGGRYYMPVIVSATTFVDGSGNRTLVPANGFTWRINCYPLGNDVVPPPVPNTDCNVKLTKGAEAPVVWETGVTDRLNYNNSGNAVDVFTTRMCPLGYKPFVQLTMGSPDNHNTNQTSFSVLNSFAYCAQRIVTSGNRYAIKVLYTARRTPITKTSTDLTISDHQAVNSAFYNIQWTLYCYPPGLPVPFDYEASNFGPGNQCNPNIAPYNAN